MNDLGTHILLLFAMGLAIAGMSSIYAERRDDRVVKTLPKRLVVFLFGCAVVAAVILVIEHTVARVG